MVLHQAKIWSQFAFINVLFISKSRGQGDDQTSFVYVGSQCRGDCTFKSVHAHARTCPHVTTCCERAVSVWRDQELQCPWSLHECKHWDVCFSVRTKYITTGWIRLQSGRRSSLCAAKESPITCARPNARALPYFGRYMQKSDLKIGDPRCFRFLFPFSLPDKSTSL